MPVSRKRKSTRKPAQGARGAAPARRDGARRRLAVGAVAGLLVCALGLGALSALAGSGGGGGQPSAGASASPSLDQEAIDRATETLRALPRLDPDDPLAVGAVDAPVVMVEYADFQGADAGAFARDVHPQLVDEYVDAGVLRIEFRNYPVWGPESDAAARAAWAAGRQGRFWEFYQAALGEEFERDSGRFEEDGLRRLAEQAGVPDLDRFLADLDSEAAGEAVGADTQEAYGIGITTIPSFVVNGEPLAGLLSLDDYRSVIDGLYESATDGATDSATTGAGQG